MKLVNLILIFLNFSILTAREIPFDEWYAGFTSIEDSLFIRNLAKSGELETKENELSVPADIDKGKYVFVKTATFELDSTDILNELYVTATPTDHPFRLFINDKLVMVQGIPGSKKVNYTFKAQYQLVTCNCIKPGKNRITVEIYPNHIRSGFVSVSLMDYYAAQNSVFTQSFFSYTFLTALSVNTVIIAFIFFAFYLASSYQRKDYLFFAVASIAIAGGALNITFSFPVSYELLLWKIARISLVFSPVMVLLFEIYYNKLEVKLKWLRYVVLCLACLFSLLIAIQSERSFMEKVFQRAIDFVITPSLLSFSLLSLYCAVRKKRLVDFIILFGCIVVNVAGFHDIYFYNNNQIPYVWLALYGYLVLEISIVSALVYDMFMLFKQREQQAEIIIKHNQELEKKSLLIKKMSHEKQELLKNMAHEFKTPLQGILATSELLKKNPESTFESLSEIMDGLNIQMQKHLFNIENVIDYSIFEYDKPEVVKGRFSLHDFIESLRLIFKHNEYNLDNKLKVTIDENIPKKYYGSERQLRRIILGLITNISSNDGTTVLLRVHWNEIAGLLTFTMSCEGGLNDSTYELLSRYVDEDITINDATSIDELAVVVSRNLIALISGSLRISPHSIELSVPVDALEEVEEAIPENAKVLVVEDNQVNRLLICKILERFGFETIVAENGEKAIEMVLSHSPRLVFMDIQMPIMNGLLATRKIRDVLPDDDDTVIVALTANASQTECIAAGMDDFLPKPVTIDQVKAVLDRYFVKE